MITKLATSLYNRYRKWRARQVHAETYWDDDVWWAIRHTGYYDAIWYVITPANYGYIKHFLGTEMTKGELSDVMSRRVSDLDSKYEKGLHVHFWKNKKMPTDMKREMLSEAVAWIENCNIEVDKLVPGWWNYDDDLEKLCSEFGLDLAPKELSVHDYELIEDVERHDYHSSSWGDPF